MRTHGWQWVRGNHEDYVIGHASPASPRQGPAFEVFRLSSWTYEQLQGDVSALQAMPFQHSLLDAHGREVRFTHGTMLGVRDGIYHWMTDEELLPKLGLNGSRPAAQPPMAVFAVGHTHIPLVRRLNGILVANAGSAGLPFDLDTRPSYARLTCRNGDWQAEIVRVAYDLQAAVQDFYLSGYIEGAGPLSRSVLVELQEGHSMLYEWTTRYQRQVLAGEISMEESVRRFLSA